MHDISESVHQQALNASGWTTREFDTGEKQIEESKDDGKDDGKDKVESISNRRASFSSRGSTIMFGVATSSRTLVGKARAVRDQETLKKRM